MGRKRLSKWYPTIFHLTILYEKVNLNLAAVFNFVAGSLSSKTVRASYVKNKTNDFASFRPCGFKINKPGHIAIGFAAIMLLSSCQSARLQTLLKKPLYQADIIQIEQILYFVNQEKYKAALAENERLERRYDDSENVSYDYSRVIIKSARINAILLTGVIQDQRDRVKQSQDIEQLNLTNKEMHKKMHKEMNLVKKSLNAKIDELTHELKGMNIALKNMENLRAENITLQQQIEDLKKIDLQSEQNINSTQ
ncbi:MAG: hypothetical protein GY857_00005 [Desulfobacula sp.]|nr:hypothetical protein [Desulfobacula sp.]